MNLYHRWQISKTSVKVFIVLVVLAIASFSPALLSDPHDVQTTEGTSTSFNDVPLDEDGVAILGRISRFDWLEVDKVSITWSLVGSGKYRLQRLMANYHEMGSPNRAMDVYINDISKPVFSYDPIGLPMYRNRKGRSVDNGVPFSTEHTIDLGLPPFHAPDDWYSLLMFAFVIEADTNKSIPITSFEMENSGAGDFSVEDASVPDGIPSRNNFVYEGKEGPTTVEVHSYMMYPVIRRSKRARALTFFMFGTNWVMTLCSIITTSVISNRGREVKDGVAFLPITVILAIPVIRNLYPGSPPFGIYLDVVGFFPQMLIVMICTVLVLLFSSRRTVQELLPTYRGTN